MVNLERQFRVLVRWWRERIGQDRSSTASSHGIIPLPFLAATTVVQSVQGSS